MPVRRGYDKPVIDSDQAPLQAASPPATKPKRRLLVFAGLALILLAAGVVGSLILRKDAEPAAVVPAELLAQTAPITADHSSRDRQLVTPGEPAAGKPQAELPVSFLDYGRVKKTALVSGTFILWNRGNAPLLIRQAYTTCACTSAQISSAEIPPGMASQIVIQFDPQVHDMAGMTVRRGLVLETNDPAAPSVEIWIQVSIER